MTLRERIEYEQTEFNRLQNQSTSNKSQLHLIDSNWINLWLKFTKGNKNLTYKAPGPIFNESLE